jgi:hypothetical protein
MFEQYMTKKFDDELSNLQKMYNEQVQSYLRLMAENKRLKDEYFKDKELAKIKAENERLRTISPFPEKFMNKVHDHCKECNIRSIYGNFEITLTHIANFYKWTCPVCKKEIEEYW